MQNEVTLPMGTECDDCNERAGRLESAFLHHNRIHMPIMQLGVRGKRGRIRRRLGYAQRPDDKTLRVLVPREHVRQTAKGISITVPDPVEFDDLKFRRALHHIALNYVAWKFGPVVALEARFNEVRRYVREARRGESWPYAQVMLPDDNPRTQLRIHRREDAPGVTIQLTSYLDDFFVDVAGTGELHDWARANLPSDVGLL